ncbi:MAG TPA: DUF354 domain-containing protein [Acidobacteriaceae bacterium]|nr:DUF354 domain-containing protein [Acidobacteriaceae bacterium]
MTPTEEKAPAVPHGNPRTELRLVKKSRPIQKVWIDLDNSPHVPFFRPIMEELERRGFQVILTARDCFQVCELADLAGLKYRKVGRHYGKNRLAKVMGLAIRVLQLAPFILREKPGISVSHGSRSLIVLSALLGIRNVTIADYEHADLRLTNWLGSEQKKWFMTPEIISSAVYEKRGMRKDHILQYPGIKEDVYVPFFRPDEGLKRSLGFAASDVLVTLRPPASEAHYHNPESEELLAAVLEMLHQRPDVRTVLLPRTPKQESELRQAEPELFAAGRIVVPQHALDGLDLIWNSDVVISGGGTMNREAAALGVPVYSLFRGTLGAVDKHLSERGKLVLLQSAQDVRDNLKLVHRRRTQDTAPDRATALDAVVNHLHTILGNRG